MTPLLVDTSIWVQAFRADPAVLPVLDQLLSSGAARTHSWSLLEIRLGSGVPARFRTLLERLIPIAPLELEDLSAFVAFHALEGNGIGLVDAQLLASASVAGVGLWTADRALDRAARALGLPVRPR
jgi:predicted nucleic acid-binding protein